MTFWKAPALAAAPLFACLLSLGCGGEAPAETGGSGGSGGQGGETTTTTEMSATALTITELRAPDRSSIRVEVSGAQEVPMSPAAYVLSSPNGPLAVQSVAWDADGQVIVLETDRQKLGVTYTLKITSPGDGLDGEGGEVLAADTATFWATDFATFDQYELVAERVGVGEHVVLYLEPGLAAADIDETIAQFDAQIFPIETELFHPAPDRDENGRVVLLGLDGQQYYGGYFFPVDTLSDEAAMNFGYRSNEMEMLYVNVAALGGYSPAQVVAHELSHLLYEEQHPFLEQIEYHDYHNEGLAECAVHAVYGSNAFAASYYVQDPTGELAFGKSLVQWDGGNYSQYVQAYVFWTYVASQMGGVSGYRDLFLSNGSPQVIEGLLLQKLGVDFAGAQLRALAASWAQQATGIYGFEGMLSLPGGPPVVPVGTTSLSLAPFAGALFPQSNNGVTPAGAGPNIRFLGIDGAGNADVVAPFDVSGGVLVALNGLLEKDDPTPQPTGEVGGPAGMPKVLPPAASGRDPGWLHPPPVPPAKGGALEAWRLRTSGF